MLKILEINKLISNVFFVPSVFNDSLKILNLHGFV